METARAIAAEPEELSISEISRKYGVSWHHVKKIRGPQSTAIERVERAPAAGSHYDKAIEAVREQVEMFQSALNVLEGLRALEVQE